jgi:hypothetical protein
MMEAVSTGEEVMISHVARLGHNLLLVGLAILTVAICLQFI